LVKAEEAIAFLILLLGLGGKKEAPPREDKPPPDFPPPRPRDPVIPEGCGPKPPVTFQERAGYAWQPATDNLTWFADPSIRVPDSVILSINEGFSLDLLKWYRCEQLNDPIRLITQFI